MHNLKEVSEDNHLFLQAAHGSEAAFKELFHKYTPLLHPGVLQMVKHPEVAREIVQEVFLKFWLQKEQVGKMERPAGWLFRVASNLAISHLRKISSHLRWLDSVNTSGSGQETIIDSVSVKDLQKIIYEAVEALPPKRKEIFQLSRNDGWSIDQIATHLNLSRSTVKNQISIALKYVQSHIEREASICLPLFFIYFLFF